MSDTCWLHISFPRADLPRFQEVLKDQMWKGQFWDEEDGDDGEVNATIYEANYGWYDEIHALAKAGLTFTVSHGAGGEYGPCVYACSEGNLVECSANWEGTPVVPVGTDGVNQRHLQNAGKYYRVVEEIEQEKGKGSEGRLLRKTG